MLGRPVNSKKNMAFQKNLKKLALISCRGAGGFVLWRQSPWNLILQGFCGFCLFVWECQMV